MTTTQIIVTVIVVLALVAVLAGGWLLMRRRSLRQRFGPEYERLVEEKESRTAAEKELMAREKRHAQLELRPLEAADRDRYAADWQEIQVRFLDDPARSVGEAHELVTRLIAARGYPTGDFDDQLATLSVEHANTLGHYRDAHEIHLRNEAGEASTEQLRQALVHYRTLFADLLGTDPVPRQSTIGSATPETAS